MHRDLHVGRYRQFAVRALKLHARHRIAKRIDLIAAFGGRRGNLQRVLQALLVGSGPRHQVQQLMRMHDIRSIQIPRFVADVILRPGTHVASA
ncbi:MAG: hypothetical protein WDM77_19455 [Steroidobacteraceae bacterium]